MTDVSMATIIIALITEKDMKDGQGQNTVKGQYFTHTSSKCTIKLLNLSFVVPFPDFEQWQFCELRVLFGESRGPFREFLTRVVLNINPLVLEV